MSGDRKPAAALVLSLLVLFLGCPVSQDVVEQQGEANVAAAPRPNLILLTVDTLRADHVGIYGYRVPTTPAIDRLGAGGIVFDLAIAQAPWTLPSMASLHTSKFPSEHGAVHAKARVREEETMLAEFLAEAGYHTIAVVSHVFVDRKHGFAQGFDRFDESLILPENEITSSRLTEVGLAELRTDLREPFFLWIHYFDPHYSYVRHPEYGFARKYRGAKPDRIDIPELRQFAAEAGRPRMQEADIEYVRAVYDEEIRYTDDAIGRLIDGVSLLGLKRSTLFILTADHGEQFMERGKFDHGMDVYQTLVHVPLILGGDLEEALRGHRVRTPVETRSLARTLGQLAGRDASVFGGRDLLEVARGKVLGTLAYAEGSYVWGVDEHKVTVVSERWKLIHNRVPDTFELYDLVQDWEERSNVWDGEMADGNSVALMLRNELIEFSRRANQRAEQQAPELELSIEEEEHLRSLGYIE